MIVWKSERNRLFLHYKLSSKSFLEPSIHELAWNINKKSKKLQNSLSKDYLHALHLTWECLLRTAQFLIVIVSGQLDISFCIPERMMTKIHTGRATLLQLLLITRVIRDTLESKIKHRTLYFCDLHCPQEKLIRRKYLSRLFLISCTFQ